MSNTKNLCWVSHTNVNISLHTPTLKSLFKEVLLPWETPAATTAPEWIMGPSYRHDRFELNDISERHCLNNNPPTAPLWKTEAIRRMSVSEVWQDYNLHPGRLAVYLSNSKAADHWTDHTANFHHQRLSGTQYVQSVRVKTQQNFKGSTFCVFQVSVPWVVPPWESWLR